jgi:hypothetical protein
MSLTPKLVSSICVYGAGWSSFSCGSTAQFWALAASMKLPVSFQLLRSRTVGRTPWTGDQLSAPGECDDDGEVGGMNGFGRGN